MENLFELIVIHDTLNKLPTPDLGILKNLMSREFLEVENLMSIANRVMNLKEANEASIQGNYQKFQISLISMEGLLK